MRLVRHAWAGTNARNQLSIVQCVLLPLILEKWRLSMPSTSRQVFRDLTAAWTAWDAVMKRISV